MTQTRIPTSPGTSAPWVLALTSTAQFMGALDALIVSTALRTIKQQLHASVGQLEWTVSAYSLTFAVFLMTAAVLGDRFGRRRMFTAGVAVFAASSAALPASRRAGRSLSLAALRRSGTRRPACGRQL
jgi:MFS family permease